MSKAINKDRKFIISNLSNQIDKASKLFPKISPSKILWKTNFLHFRNERFLEISI